ncbi:MAG: hypothetical protein KAU20_03510 [Nanoarchaeota archaeon]|nr:hypothetical protein [Nanoarchaeota archaeon]
MKKLNISKRLVAVIIIDVIWFAVGFFGKQWEIFSTMTIPVVGLNTAYLINESVKPSNKEES